MKVVEIYWQSPVIPSISIFVDHPCPSPEPPETLIQCTAKSGFWHWRTLLLHPDRTWFKLLLKQHLKIHHFQIPAIDLMSIHANIEILLYHYMDLSNTFGIGPNFSMLPNAEGWIWACIHVGYPGVMVCHDLSVENCHFGVYPIFRLRNVRTNYGKLAPSSGIEETANQGTRWSCGKNRPNSHGHLSLVGVCEQTRSKSLKLR